MIFEKANIDKNQKANGMDNVVEVEVLTQCFCSVDVGVALLCRVVTRRDETPHPCLFTKLQWKDGRKATARYAMISQIFRVVDRGDGEGRMLVHMVPSKILNPKQNQ